MKKIKKFFNRGWPILFIFFVCFWLFRPFFLKGLLPIPSDIIVGVYYPWLDYKWGFPTGVPVKNPLISDVPSLLYPWRSFAIDELKSGRWPLWNPYYFTGMPLLANFQSAVFSYVNIFFLFFSKPIAWSLGIMTSPLLTMLTMYVFLRHKKLEKLSSLLGAVIFSLSGFEIAWLEYNVLCQTALFLPLFLLTIDLFFENKKWSLFLISFLVAFQIFSGYIPLVIYSYVVCIFYILFFYFIPELKQRRIKWGRYFLLLGFWVVGLGVSAIQLFPGYELFSLSIRKIDPIVSNSNASFLPFKNLITLLAPDFFGNPATGNYFGQAFYDNFYFFVGTGSLIFILFSLFFLKKSKIVLFWWGMLIFSFILCFKNPLGLFLEKLLFLSGGAASKALFITDFSLSLLAAFGFNYFFKGEVKQRKKIFASISLLFTFFLFSGFLALRLEENYRVVSIRNLIIPLASFFACTLIILTTIRFRRFTLGKLLLIITIIWQLFYSAKKYLPFSKQELLFPTTPVIDFLKQKQSESKDPFRVELGDVIPQNFLMPYGIETTSGYDALLPRKTAGFLSLLEEGKIEEKISRVQLIDNYRSQLFPLLNTKYILAKKMASGEISSRQERPFSVFQDKRFRLVFEDKTVQVYEDTQFLPRAFWVHDYMAVNQEDFMALLSDKFDFSQKVILEKPIEFFPPLLPAKINLVRWKEYLPGKLKLEVESDQPGLVFLSNNYFPGWQAFVDDKKSEIYRANYTFQAILVAEGRHLLTLKYQPETFLYGGLVSVFVLANGWLFSVIFILRYLWEKKG